MLTEKLKKIIDKNQHLFITLEEMDRTGKLGKIRHKERYTFTLDRELMRKFREDCKRKRAKMSNRIEELVEFSLK